jgi:hypothetical protein
VPATSPLRAILTLYVQVDQQALCGDQVRAHGDHNHTLAFSRLHPYRLYADRCRIFCRVNLSRRRPSLWSAGDPCTAASTAATRPAWCSRPWPLRRTAVVRSSVSIWSKGLCYYSCEYSGPSLHETLGSLETYDILHSLVCPSKRLSRVACGHGS